jgi:hypothetical protein
LSRLMLCMLGAGRGELAGQPLLSLFPPSRV